MEHLFEYAKWLGAGGAASKKSPARPAPFFRKSFQLEEIPQKAEVYFCGLGYSELYLNGVKVDDGVLQPVVTQYEKRAHYLKYDVTKLLQKGENVFGVILGNGWYNCTTPNTWGFQNADWRDYPKMILEMYCNDKIFLHSDTTWKCLKNDGPIVFDALREGETYDARLEQNNWNLANFDDSNWSKAVIVPGVGGILTEQTMPPCRVIKCLPMEKVIPGPPKDKVIYDALQVITGWAKIKVHGNSGAKITLTYSELMDPYNVYIDRKEISTYALSDRFQKDEYILKGSATFEEWQPRFVYHGFRYVEVEIEGNATIEEISACLVHTDFETLTQLKSSDPILNKLHSNTCYSFIDNFTGIPTDCPHREKNGWTGDAQLASEMGLFHYDLESSYFHWLQSICDVQWPNGQIPGIVPTCGWGYNTANGPAYDSALILIAWNIYIYTGKTRCLAKYYDHMKRYVKYLATMAENNILAFGLGDWCPVELRRITDKRITSTAYYYADACIMEKIATLLGKENDSLHYKELASNIKKSFVETFYLGNGIFGCKDNEFRDDDVTALATSLYWNLCPESECAITAKRLNDIFVARQYKADFGILGSKYILRVLSDYGYQETAYNILMQPAYPGWVDWINHGATTLWEQWRGSGSQCHIMHGDIAAWMIQYLAGIVPSVENPGFSKLTIKPFAPAKLDSLTVTSKLACGKVTVSWKKNKGKFILDLTIPKGVPCTVILPDGTSYSQIKETALYECLI